MGKAALLSKLGMHEEARAHKSQATRRKAIAFNATKEGGDSSVRKAQVKGRILRSIKRAMTAKEKSLGRTLTQQEKRAIAAKALAVEVKAIRSGKPEMKPKRGNAQNLKPAVKKPKVEHAEQSQSDRKRITKEDANKTPWMYSARQYQYAHGVHEPHIAEASPHQMGSMGKREKKEYMEKRSSDWQASGAIKQEWAKKVIQAHDEGKFSLDDPSTPKDTRDIVRGTKRAETKQDLGKALTSHWSGKDSLSSSLEHLDQVKVGDRVFDSLRGDHFVVARKFATSVSGTNDKGETHKLQLGSMHWGTRDQINQALQDGKDPKQLIKKPLSPALELAEQPHKSIPETKRLRTLKDSLEKKQEAFDSRLDAHIQTVKQANGQPLNDKRNGQATLNKWEKQNQTLRNIQEGIKKTKSAIENEEGKIIDSHATKEKLPKEITNLLDSGGLVQWRKYPNTFFVEGVDKARISWDFKKGVLSHKYLSSITDPEQRKKFAKAYNTLHTALGMGSGKDGK